MPTQAEKTLVSLDEVKTFLNITDTNSDEILGQLIAQISQDVVTETDRKLIKGTYTDYLNGDHAMTKLFLKEYPVASITSIHDDSDRDYGADTLISSDDYSFDPDSGIVYLDIRVASGVRNVKVVYAAGYDPMPADVKLLCNYMIGREFLLSRTNVNSAEGLELLQTRLDAMEKRADKILDKYRRFKSG